MAIIMGLGLLFYILLGFRYLLHRALKPIKCTYFEPLKPTARFRGSDLGPNKVKGLGLRETTAWTPKVCRMRTPLASFFHSGFSNLPLEPRCSIYGPQPQALDRVGFKVERP